MKLRVVTESHIPSSLYSYLGKGHKYLRLTGSENDDPFYGHENYTVM